MVEWKYKTFKNTIKRNRKALNMSSKNVDLNYAILVNCLYDLEVYDNNRKGWIIADGLVIGNDGE